MKWLLLSDILPLMIFVVLFYRSPSMMLFGMIICRICSLIFHIFQESRPHLINLDFIGIAFMVFASRTACHAVESEHCDAYSTILFASFSLYVALAFYGLMAKQKDNPFNHRGIIILATLGHYPCAYAIYVGHNTSTALIFSATAFSVGYFVVEPLNHAAWHWAAAVGQISLLYTCSTVTHIITE